MIKFYYCLLHAHLKAYDLHMYIITDNDMIGQVWEYKIIKLLPSFFKNRDNHDKNGEDTTNDLE